MDEPNRMVALELLITGLLVVNGVVGLRKGGVLCGGRFVFRVDQPRLWRWGVVVTFGLAGALALHLIAIAVTRITS